MIKNIWILVLLLSGCTIAQVETPPAAALPALKVFPSAQAIEQLTLGLSRQEVQEKVGMPVVVGYETETSENSESPSKVKSIAIKNPYKTESIEKNNKRYEVDYYLTHIYHPDGIVTEDELTPLVFENGRLIGKGQGFLGKIK